MINQQGNITDSCSYTHACCIKCVSWSAIFVGALVGIGLSFLLNLFGMSIGLSAFVGTAPTTADEAKTIAIGGLIGLAIITIVSMGVAGWVAGCLGRNTGCPSKHTGLLYGFTTWTVALILTVLLSSHIGSFLSGQVQMPAVTAPTQVTTTNDRNAELINVQDNANSTNVVVNTEKATKAIALTTFITFVLFALGALASCIGAHCGCCCSRDKYRDNNPPTTRV